MVTTKIFKLVALSAVLTAGILTTGFTKANAAEMRDSQDIVDEMGVGWNLGNSLDAYYSEIPAGSSPDVYETIWGNPVTTKAMIDKIKDAGFKTVRIPITWSAHIGDAPDYTIEPDWMNRVQEVVDYCIDDDLYVIINVHHDESWCSPTYAAEANVTPKLKSLWTQVSTRFKDYDDHLIFETLNEPRLLNSPEEWSGGTTEGRDVVNHYNQTALDAIRETGDNNADRSVMIPTYGASASDNTIKEFKLPKDDHVIVSLHAYIPYFFALAPTDNPLTTKEWGTDSDKLDLQNTFDYYAKSFKGTPIVIGEFASANRDNLDARVAHAKEFVSAALNRNMACIWWDNNVATPNNGESLGIFNRQSLTWYSPEIKDALINTYNEIKNPKVPQDETKDLTITSEVNGWGTGFNINMTIKNNTDSDVNNWTLKIKKSDLNLTTSWDADIKEDGEYFVLTPKDWKKSIPANGSIIIGGQGNGSGSTTFKYEFLK